MSVVSDSLWPHRRQPTRLLRPWNSPGKNTGVGCHFLLQCIKVKSESAVAESCLAPRDPMDCSPPGSSVHGVSQARVLEWGVKVLYHYVNIERSCGQIIPCPFPEFSQLRKCSHPLLIGIRVMTVGPEWLRYPGPPQGAHVGTTDIFSFQGKHRNICQSPREWIAWNGFHFQL